MALIIHIVQLLNFKGQENEAYVRINVLFNWFGHLSKIILAMRNALAYETHPYLPFLNFIIIAYTDLSVGYSLQEFSLK